MKRHLAGGALDGVRILFPEILAQVQVSSAAALRNRVPQIEAHGYGMGWWFDRVLDDGWSRPPPSGLRRDTARVGVNARRLNPALSPEASRESGVEDLRAQIPIGATTLLPRGATDRIEQVEGAGNSAVPDSATVAFGQVLRPP